MTELEITKDFTIDDIHKIREYNYEHIKNLPQAEQAVYYKNKAEAFLKESGIKSDDYPHTSLKNRRSPHPGGSPSGG